MYKVTVLADPDSADGFRLSGVEVIELKEGQEARETLAKLLDDDTVGIIAISDDFMPFIDERTKNKIEKIYRPIVVEVPSKKRIEVGERGEFLRALIRRAIGFEIKLGRE